MAASKPRRKLFDFPSTPTSALSSCLSFFIWIVLALGSFLLLFQTPESLASEVFLDPELFKQESNVVSRVPREIIRLDKDDDQYMGYSNPTVLEGGAKGRSAGGDAYETLRQMSLASTQPFIKRRLFNTSVALTVPLFSFTLPQRAAEGSTVDLANQAIFGLFALLTTLMVFAVPVLFTGIRPFDVYGRSMKSESSSQDILDSLMKNTVSSNTINFMGTDLQNKIGLNPDDCLKKTICDAHKNPKKYGLFSLPFQMFFPPPAPGTSDSRSIDPYQQAAQMGEYTKHECWEMYNCFFDVMDLAVYFRDWFTPASDSEDDSVKTS